MPGLGIRAAARAYGLDFFPLAKERYDLILAAEDRQRSPLREILEILAATSSDPWSIRSAATIRAAPPRSSPCSRLP